MFLPQTKPTLRTKNTPRNSSAHHPLYPGLFRADNKSGGKLPTSQNLVHSANIQIKILQVLHSLQHHHCGTPCIALRFLGKLNNNMSHHIIEQHLPRPIQHGPLMPLHIIHISFYHIPNPNHAHIIQTIHPTVTPRRPGAGRGGGGNGAASPIQRSFLGGLEPAGGGGTGAASPIQRSFLGGMEPSGGWAATAEGTAMRMCRRSGSAARGRPSTPCESLSLHATAGMAARLRNVGACRRGAGGCRRCRRSLGRHCV